MSQHESLREKKSEEAASSEFGSEGSPENVSPENNVVFDEACGDRSDDSALAPWPGGTVAIVLSVLVSGGIALHMLMTAIYLGPPNLAKLELQSFVLRYMEPVFIQNWHLFSPMPAISSTKMPVRCQSGDGSWTEWVDPLEELYATHYRARVTGHGKLLMLYRSVGADLHERLVEQRAECLVEARETEADTNLCGLPKMAPRVQEEPVRELAARFATDVCAANLNAEFRAAQFKVMDFVPVKYSERESSTARWGSVTEVVFPPVSASTGFGSTVAATPQTLNSRGGAR